MQVNEDVLRVLEQAKFVGHNLYLNHLGNLDRKLYTDTNKVLEALGGKWNRAQKAHVFEGLPDEAIEQVLTTGEYSRTKQDLGQFDTPQAVVERIMELSEIADFPDTLRVLEPSAGVGNIVTAAENAGASVTAFELDAKRLHIAKERCVLAGGIRLSNFLLAKPESVFDLVLMNPPFAKQIDIDHVMHAAKFLKPGGRLVSVMSASVLFRDNKKTADFRDWVRSMPTGIMEQLPEFAFKESGTAVRACIVAVDLP